MNYRIWRSSNSRFCSEQLPSGKNDETLTAVNAYTDEELQKGFDGLPKVDK